MYLVWCSPRLKCCPADFFPFICSSQHCADVFVLFLISSGTLHIMASVLSVDVTYKLTALFRKQNSDSGNSARK